MWVSGNLSQREGRGGEDRRKKTRAEGAGSTGRGSVGAKPAKMKRFGDWRDGKAKFRLINEGRLPVSGKGVNTYRHQESDHVRNNIQRQKSQREEKRWRHEANSDNTYNWGSRMRYRMRIWIIEKVGLNKEYNNDIQGVWEYGKGYKNFKVI